jgi:hypothetical protein
MAISTPTSAVNPSHPYPAFCILRNGDKPSCVFPYEGPEGDKFVTDMVLAGWAAERIDECMVLTAPPEQPNTATIIPFPKHFLPAPT